MIIEGDQVSQELEKYSPGFLDTESFNFGFVMSPCLCDSIYKAPTSRQPYERMNEGVFRWHAMRHGKSLSAKAFHARHGFDGSLEQKLSALRPPESREMKTTKKKNRNQ